jgi:hypothetical protein
MPDNSNFILPTNNSLHKILLINSPFSLAPTLIIISNYLILVMPLANLNTSMIHLQLFFPITLLFLLNLNYLSINGLNFVLLINFLYLNFSPIPTLSPKTHFDHLNPLSKTFTLNFILKKNLNY